MLGINLGYCSNKALPEIYTSLLSEPVWRWVANAVSPDPFGTDGDGVEFSTCHDHSCGYEAESQCENPDRPSVTAEVGGSSIVNISSMSLFQPWETDCRCGNRDEWKSIVQFYREYENDVWQIVKNKPKLKIPIGLGTLISYHHVLTTKTCFGRPNNVGVWQRQEH